mmetsp:Transcript_1461/g.1965  ORF Transcript_1461/g.1965 Transcript_1461/m.1965 type:complete len:642 (-) Transcript_1461:393-2318(-)|eukprot:CAMPEP_0178902838 /NCGR_PEP_ID=MMETSP0786-20121207/4827_1 /TAXON_ID=186022 /ORGANISM="Thalassionema frauenfeldii, Strain CCMP 1798" /LENGTH=641 /DNA_ID=CAMNT_0020574149 /DNA_START=255 /DNA_END=2180 /DNA_ORIENTATION=-
MGNETSAPEDDGLQPPSQIPPQTSFETSNESRGPLKVVKAALQRTNVDPDPRVSGDNNYSHNQQQTYSYNSTSAGDGNNFSHTSKSGFHNQKAAHMRNKSLDPSQAVPVFFASASEGGAGVRNSQNQASSLPTSSGMNSVPAIAASSSKAVRNGGRALINSMRNLTVATGSRKSNHGPQREENDWETKWDEDDDESDGEEEEVNNEAKKEIQKQAVDLLSEPIGASQSNPSQTPPQIPKVGFTGDLDWEKTSVNETKPPEYDKPNVQMFLPLLRVLGKGSFGKVVLVQKRIGHESGTMFAMKILRKVHLVKRRQIERTRTERKVLSVVDHPFIMKLHYAFQTEDKLYLVLDYCPGGELFFHLSRFRRFPERVARFYSAELLLAIGHLHKRGIIYRDLKPENVLLDAEGHVKLGDFGLAKLGIRHPCQGATSMCGTPEYMAPEVLGQQGHGFCVDYWGLGMLTFEMMTGLPPWYTTDRQKLFRRLKSAPLEIPSFFSPQAANCVSQLLQRDPTRRLGVTGIRTSMEHDFFRSINWRALYARRVDAPIRPCDGWSNDKSFSSAGDDALDAATANFDNQFTRMKVDTDEGPQDNNNHPDNDENDAAEELHANTFVGFTFDGPQEDIIGPPMPRHRNHQYNSTSD